MAKRAKTYIFAQINGERRIVRGGVKGSLEHATARAKLYWKDAVYVGEATELYVNGMDICKGEKIHCFK